MSKSIKLAGLFPSAVMFAVVLFALVPLGETATGPQIMAPTNRYINVGNFSLTKSPIPLTRPPHLTPPPRLSPGLLFTTLLISCMQRQTQIIAVGAVWHR